jgi:hypothetical protein
MAELIEFYNIRYKQNAIIFNLIQYLVFNNENK